MTWCACANGAKLALITPIPQNFTISLPCGHQCPICQQQAVCNQALSQIPIPVAQSTPINNPLQPPQRIVSMAQNDPMSIPNQPNYNQSVPAPVQGMDSSGIGGFLPSQLQNMFPMDEFVDYGAPFAPQSTVQSAPSYNMGPGSENFVSMPCASRASQSQQAAVPLIVVEPPTPSSGASQHTPRESRPIPTRVTRTRRTRRSVSPSTESSSMPSPIPKMPVSVNYNNMMGVQRACPQSCSVRPNAVSMPNERRRAAPASAPHEIHVFAQIDQASQRSQGGRIKKTVSTSSLSYLQRR